MGASFKNICAPIRELLELKMPSRYMSDIFPINLLISVFLKIYLLSTLMHLGEIFPLQEIKKHLFSKIAIIFIPIT